MNGRSLPRRSPYRGCCSSEASPRVTGLHSNLSTGPPAVSQRYLAPCRRPGGSLAGEEEEEKRENKRLFRDACVCLFYFPPSRQTLEWFQESEKFAETRCGTWLSARWNRKGREWKVGFGRDIVFLCALFFFYLFDKTSPRHSGLLWLQSKHKWSR